MTQGDFIHLVKQMRDAQKAYFRKRDIALLNVSKQLESQVDQAIRVLTGLPL